MKKIGKGTEYNAISIEIFLANLWNHQTKDEKWIRSQLKVEWKWIESVLVVELDW